LQTPWPTTIAVKKTGPMTPARRDYLLAFADQLEALTEDWGPDFSYYRAAAALRDFVDEADGAPAPTTPLRWLLPSGPAGVRHQRQ
jgi:hypothetical protein